MYHSSPLYNKHIYIQQQNIMHAKYIFYIVLPSRMQFIAYNVCLLYCLCQRISPSFDFPFLVSPMHLFSFSLYRCSLKRRRRSKKYKKWCPWGLSVMLWPIATFLMHLFEVRTSVRMCVVFASKITDGIVTGSTWSIYGVFLFLNGDLFAITPIILNGTSFNTSYFC